MSESTSSTKSPKRLSFALKYFFGVGDGAFKLMSNMETFYFTFFMTNLAGFTPAMAALVSSVMSMIDMCLSWAYGAILNSTKAMKWGRYRSWLIVVPWIVPFLYAFQFIKISGDVKVSAVVVTIAAVVSHAVWNFPYAANSTLVAVVGKTPEDKATLASSRAAWNNVVAIFFSYLGLPLANLLAGVVGEVNKIAAAAFCMGIVMVIGYYAHFKMTEGYEDIEDTSKPSKSKATVREMFASLFKNPTLMVLIVADLAKWIVNFVVAASAIYYFTYSAGNAKLQVTYLLATGIAGTVGAYFFRVVAKKFSSRNSMIGSYILMAVCLILVYFFYAQPYVVIGLMTCTLFVYGTAFAAAPALYADTVVYATWKTGKDASGWIMGLQTLPLKVGVFLRGIILPAVLASIGFNAKTMTYATMSAAQRQSITISFGLLPGIFCIVGALLLIFGFKLTKEKVLGYQAEIDKRG